MCQSCLHISIEVSAIGPKSDFLFLERTKSSREVPIGCLTTQSYESLEGKPPFHSGVRAEETFSSLGPRTPEPQIDDPCGLGPSLLDAAFASQAGLRSGKRSDRTGTRPGGAGFAH